MNSKMSFVSNFTLLLLLPPVRLIKVWRPGGREARQTNYSPIELEMIIIINIMVNNNNKTLLYENAFWPVSRLVKTYLIQIKVCRYLYVRLVHRFPFDKFWSRLKKDR